MVELNGVRIWAVGAGDGGRPRKLACGTLARPVDGGSAPPLGPRIGLPGRPDVVIDWSGWFALATTGEVVGVYGAVVEAVG